MTKELPPPTVDEAYVARLRRARIVFNMHKLGFAPMYLASISHSAEKEALISKAIGEAIHNLHANGSPFVFLRPYGPQNDPKPYRFMFENEYFVEGAVKAGDVTEPATDTWPQDDAYKVLYVSNKLLDVILSADFRCADT